MIISTPVASDYLHHPKIAKPGFPLHTSGCSIKWYDLAMANAMIPNHMSISARAFCSRNVANYHGDFGFIILHRCGKDFYFLLTSVWRGSNELWQSVHYQDCDMDDFAPFDPAYPRPGMPRPTFCVWELGVVGHESRAWAQYLSSSRDAADLSHWENSIFDGEV